MWEPMGKVKSVWFILTLFTGIFLGISIGAALLNALVSYRIDDYYKEIQYLNTVIENKDERLEKLETSLNNKFVMVDIKVNLVYITEDTKENADGMQFDELDKITIEDAIRDKYKKLIGREVKDIDSSIIGDIIDNRIMKTDHAEYKLHISKIVLSDVLELWVNVEKVNMM